MILAHRRRCSTSSGEPVRAIANPDNRLGSRCDIVLIYIHPVRIVIRNITPRTIQQRTIIRISGDLFLWSIRCSL